ncbi:MAG: translocation/assembly module TamB domain-containing protein [Pseudomonadota bacterium]|nr:translocation/assembly module TamB domain-containing protein [Pseudomonadota bacterium]
MRRHIVIILISLLILLASFVAWLGLTESGLSFVISQAERFVPELSIKKTSGRFYDGADFEQINYQIDDSSNLSITNLAMSWQVMHLFSGQLVIDKLQIGDVVITQHALKNTESSPIALPNINIPLAISLKNISVNSLTSIDPSQNKVQLISGFNTDVTLWGDKLKIQSLSIHYAHNVSLQLSGAITLSGHYKTDLAYQWTVIDPKLKTISAEGNIKGNLAELKLEQQLLTPVQSTQSISVSDLLDKVIWSANIEVPQLVLADFVEDQTGVIHQLTLKANGDLTRADLLLDSQFKQTSLPDLSLHSQTSTTGFDDWLTDTNISMNDGAKLLIKGQINQVLTAPNLALTGQWQQLVWPLLEPKKTVKSAKGDFTVNGDLENYNIVINSELEAEQQHMTWQANAQGTSNKIDLKQLQINGFGGKATLAGWFNWQSGSSFELATSWQDIVLPEAFSPLMMNSKNGELVISGTTEKYTLTSAVALSVDAKFVTIDIEGAGTDKGFKKLIVNTKTGNGNIGFDGELYWLDAFKLNGKINLHNINPDLFSAEWPGDLSGGWIMSVDNLHDKMADIRIEALDVKGSLRKRPLHLQGELSYIKSVLNIPNLQLVSGKSTISVNGHMQDSLALNWLLDSPDLADLYPDLGGQLNASATVTGKLDSPIIKATLSGQKIAYADGVSIAKASSDFSLDMQGQVRGKVVLTDMKMNTFPVHNAELNIAGSKESHQLSFEVSGEQINASGNVSGKLTDTNWQGQLTKLKLDQTQAGVWNLTKQGRINLASDQGLIEEQCLQSDKGDICFHANYSPEGNWQGAGRLNKLSMSVLHAFVPALDPIEGQIQGQFELSGSNQYPTKGQGELSLVNGRILLDAIGQKEKRIIPLKTVKFDYLLTNQNTSANVFVAPDLKGVSPLTGKIELPILEVVMNDPNTATLSGAFKTKVEDLSIFDDLNPEYDNLKGQLNVDMSLTGTVKHPALIGKIKLDKSSIELPSLGLILTDININAQGSLDKGIEFSYQAKSGKGNLVGDGQFISIDDTWQMDANLKATNAELVSLPEAYVIASADLKFSMNTKSSQVTGSVTVPEAELAPLQFNMPVSPSKDVIVLNKNASAAEKKPFPTILDVNVTLGDKVKIAAVGFNSRLTGKLVVTGNTSKILLGTGAIIIKDGKYTAYGQKLAVDDGKILFSGGALDNPQLDVKAFRKGEGFTAGLHLQGAANNPQITLFSTPAMSQDNILAYIVLGRPIGEASVSDAALLASAATGLGIKGGNQMGDRIASTFGLDSFGIKGDGGEDTALQIGKYLSPKLYLGYGIGIFEPVSTVIMRYKLSKIWSLKAESGIETSVDFLYTHER